MSIISKNSYGVHDRITDVYEKNVAYFWALVYLTVTLELFSRFIYKLYTRRAFVRAHSFDNSWSLSRRGSRLPWKAFPLSPDELSCQIWSFYVKPYERTGRSKSTLRFGVHWVLKILQICPWHIVYQFWKKLIRTPPSAVAVIFIHTNSNVNITLSAVESSKW